MWKVEEHESRRGWSEEGGDMGGGKLVNTLEVPGIH